MNYGKRSLAMLLIVMLLLMLPTAALAYRDFGVPADNAGGAAQTPDMPGSEYYMYIEGVGYVKPEGWYYPADAVQTAPQFAAPAYSAPLMQTRSSLRSNAYLNTGIPSDGVPINSANFPDANFRSLVQSIAGSVTALSDGVIARTTSINCSGRSIANLTGIGYFTALQSLNCSGNRLTALNLSANTALTTLDCSNNLLTSLDLSHNTHLTTLVCRLNRMKLLDLSANTALGGFSADNYRQAVSDGYVYVRGAAGCWTVNMSSLLPADAFSKVSVNSADTGMANASFDRTRGIVTFAQTAAPTSMVYRYDTGRTNVYLPVMVSLTNGGLGSNVARVGTTLYTSFDSAFNAVSSGGGTIELLSNASVSGALVVPAGKTITINANGYRLTSSCTGSGAAITVKGTLSFNNGSFRYASKHGFRVESMNSLRLSGATLTASSVAGGAAIQTANGYVTISGASSVPSVEMSGSTDRVQVNGSGLSGSNVGGDEASVTNSAGVTTYFANVSTAIKSAAEGSTVEIREDCSITGSVTVPAGVTLRIPSGTALQVPAGTSLTNNGTVVGNITNNGGTITHVPSSQIINAPEILTTWLPGGSKGCAYRVQLYAQSSTYSINWSATGLPAGLSINAGTGVISGTPTVTGSFTVQVRATYAGTSASSTKDLPLYIYMPSSGGYHSGIGSLYTAPVTVPAVSAIATTPVPEIPATGGAGFGGVLVLAALLTAYIDKRKRS